MSAMEFKGRFLGFIIDSLDATNLIERLKLQLSAFHFLCAKKDFIVNYKFTIKFLGANACYTKNYEYL